MTETSIVDKCQQFVAEQAKRLGTFDFDPDMLVWAGGPLKRRSIRRVCLLTLTEMTGGAPLLALFEKWPAEPPTPFDSASRGRRSHLHRNHFPPIHHIQRVITNTDIPTRHARN
jgi:hypothetical protein